MGPEKIRIWLYCFLSAQRFKKSRKNRINLSPIKQNFLNLKISKKSNYLFKSIIFNIVNKIGIECRKYQISISNNLVNQHFIIKSFIYSNLIESNIWIFKFRKYFSKYRVKRAPENLT